MRERELPDCCSSVTVEDIKRTELLSAWIILYPRSCTVTVGGLVCGEGVRCVIKRTRTVGTTEPCVYVSGTKCVAV